MVAHYVRRSKITINFSYHNPKKRLFRGRVWEAINCGAMLMEEENNSIRHFLEPMKHYVPFSGVQDAVDKARYFLNHQNERKTIVDDGYKAVTGRYNSATFWTECIRLIY
jgi:spore maturation protein CgeB